MPNDTLSARPCGFDGCDRPHKARGLCYTHWAQRRRGLQLAPIREYRTQPITCAVDDCTRDPHAQNLCKCHYRQSRSGDGSTRPIGRHFGGIPVSTRIEWATREANVTADGCWLWPGKLNNYGYAVLRSGNKHLQAHRVSYELWVRPIPEGTVVHHVCATRACFNPEHLQAVTPQENIAEMLVRKSYEAEITALKLRVEELESTLRLHGFVI